MSEPIRYSFYAVLTHHIDGPDTAEIRFQKEKDGLFVYWEDYARLKDENERLRKEVETYYRESMNDEYDLNNQSRIINGLLRDKEQLKAEVERLRKAGYAMAVKINVHGIADKFTDSQKLVDDWSAAAKEGKPQS